MRIQTFTTDCGWLGKANPERVPASFILFVPGKPGLKVVAQDGTPLPPEHLISSVNLRVETRGTEAGDTFRLLEMRKRGLIKRKYIHIIDHCPKIRPDGYWWVSIDSALSTSETADYSALTLGYSNSDGHFVLYVERGRWDYEMLKCKALCYVRRFGDNVIFIVEAAGSGISLIEYMRKAQLRCFHHQAKHGKVERASLVLPVFLAGRVHICNVKSHNGWVEEFINELLTFPNGRHDDQVDSLVQALRWAEPRVNPGGRCYLV